VPFLVRWPGHIEPGTVSDELVSLIDLAPTWMKIAGINPPEYMQGKDLLDSSLPERDYVFSARDRCDETDDRIRCVRSKKYKYIRNFYPDRPYTFFNAYKKNKYPVLTLLQVLKEQNKLTPEQEKFMADYRPVEELYDLETDPYEVNNLAEKAGYQEILKEYRTRLDEWICQTKDKGQVPEDREVAHKWDKQMADLYKQWMTNKGLSPNVSNEKYLEWWKTELEQQKKAL
jgi:uncharacterized sulfatase